MLAAQQEYPLGYALAFCMVLLGLLVVCIPRPRKSKFLTPKELEKERRKQQKQKAGSSKKRRNKSANLAAVKAPAIALIIVASLSILMFLISVSTQLMTGQIDTSFSGARSFGQISAIPLLLASYLAVLFGGISMLQRKHFNRSRIGCIVACIPCLSPLVILGIPFGIWGLMILSRAGVRDGFDN